MLVVLCSRSRSVDPSSSRKKTQHNGVSAIENQLSPPRDIRLPTWFQHDFLTQCWGDKRKALAELVSSDSGVFVNLKDRSLNTSILHIHQKKNMCKTNRIFCCTFPTIYKFSSVNKRSTCCPKYFPSFPKKKNWRPNSPAASHAHEAASRIRSKVAPNSGLTGSTNKIWIWQTHGTRSWCSFLLKQKMQPSKNIKM